MMYLYIYSDRREDLIIMRLPKDNTVSIALDPAAREIVARIERTYDGKIYEEGRKCPCCGSESHIRADMRRRIFCRVIKEDGIKEISVYGKNFRCKRCGHIYTSRLPFYEHAKFGSAIVDLALYFASFQGYNQASKSLQSLGIWVDRDTIRRWAGIFHEKIDWYRKTAQMGDPVAVVAFKLLFPDDTG